MQEDLYYLGFSLFSGVGSVLFEKLIKEFGSAKSAWSSKEERLQKILGDKLTSKFIAFRKSINLEEEKEKLVQKGIRLVTFVDKEYPGLLKQIMHPPFLLYVKGNLEIFSSPKIIGIVGTRKITPYGKEVTQMLTTELVQKGFVIVSGLAFGVDAVAHITTMQNNGKTIAVLGCGVDMCVPSSNQKIYDEILTTGGGVISTFPPGMEATKGSFPARNALIAGLSQAILVTEGAAGSGSLITAAYAKKFNRPVFSVPGPITSSLSKGANGLLKNGGIAVTCAEDILDSLGIMNSQKTQSNQKIRMSENPDEQSILKLLEFGPLHFDEIVRTIGKDSKTVGSLLSLMELSGFIHQESGKYYL